jgi:cytochrome c553
MARLIIFIGFLSVVALALTFSKFKKLEPSQKNFDFQETKNAYEKKQKAIELALNPPEMKKEKKEAVEIKVELTTPELQNGHAVYTKKGQCITCHGKHGEGKKSQKAPRLAGQYRWYTETQLTNMKAGRRINEKMNPYLKRIDEQDIKDVALYLSKFPPQPLD